MARVVVLLGPPGSGKTTVGRELCGRGLRWRDWEPVIVRRWGGRDEFVARKAEALPRLHDEIRAWVAAGGAPAVLETTGLSDAPLIDTLERDHQCFVVRLDVSEDEAVRRVAARRSGEHLSDDASRNRAIWQAFHTAVGPRRRVDLVVDTERVRPACLADQILAATGFDDAGAADQ